jgi:hypothetical protein
MARNMEFSGKEKLGEGIFVARMLMNTERAA